MSSSIKRKIIDIILFTIFIGFFLSYEIYQAFVDVGIQKRKKIGLGNVIEFTEPRGAYVKYHFNSNNLKIQGEDLVKKTTYVKNCLYNEKGRYEPKCVGDTLTIVYDSLKPERNYVQGLTANHCETNDCFFVKLLLFLGIDGD